ncbi:MAG: hypothetical protein ACI9MC_002645 [Kiritimatiellia bacterium]|jgi:hypothetical protein
MAARVPVRVIQRAPPPRSIQWERKRVVGRVGLPLEPVVQRWTRFNAGRDAVVYDVITGGEEQGLPKVAQQLRYDRAGLSIVAEGTVKDGTPNYSVWEPPLLMLPPDAALGRKWSSQHTFDEQTVQRDCEILRSNLCDDGMVVVCDRSGGDLRLVTRDHYCAGQGWGGYESLLVREGQPAVRTWTEGLRRLE